MLPSTGENGIPIANIQHLTLNIISNNNPPDPNATSNSNVVSNTKDSKPLSLLIIPSNCNSPSLIPIMNNMEQWRSLDILGYPNYQVSSNGRFRNITTNNYIKSCITPDGYRRIGLSNGKAKKFMVHQLVARVFIPLDDYTGMTVDHINRLRDDNRACNLRWASINSQNENRKASVSKYSRPINEYDINGNFIIQYESLTSAGKSSIATEAIIGRICKGKGSSTFYNGYTWRYADEDFIEGEIWRQISYEDCIEISVSNKGRIIQHYNRPIKGSITNGYYRISVLSRQTGKLRMLRVHRLVIAAFYGENPDMVVNHIDGNSLNNNLENLEYVTQKENMKHAVETGLQPIGLKYRPVIITDKYGVETRYNTCVEAAEAIGMCRKTIAKWCKGITTSKSGYKARYKTTSN